MISARLPFLTDDVRKVVKRSQAKHDIDVGQAKVGVQQHDALVLQTQRQGQIDRDVGLADAALAAGHADDPHRPALGWLPRVTDWIMGRFRQRT
jgi:hypothetical protein